MKKLKVIVNSELLGSYLVQALDEAADTLEFREAPPYNRLPGLMVGELALGVANRSFEPFTVEREQVVRLKNIALDMVSQPITLVYDGGFFTITDFLI